MSFSKPSNSRAYFDQYYCQDDEIDIAIEWSRRNQSSPKSKVCVVLFSLENLEYSTRLKTSPKDFHFVTFDQLVNGDDASTRGSVVALWPTKQMLLQLEAHSRSTAIVAVTWFLGDVAEWAKNQNAKNLHDTDLWKIDGTVLPAQLHRIKELHRIEKLRKDSKWP